MLRTATLLGLTLLLALPAPAPAGDEVLGKKAPEWLKILRTDTQVKRRRAALTALEVFGPKTDGVLQGLLAALQKDTDPEIRREVAQTFGRLGEDARLAIPGLARALGEDKAGDVREAAAKALGNMVPYSKSVAAELARALKDPHPGTRTAAASTVKDLGADAIDALNPAVELVKNGKDPKTEAPARVYAAQFLGRLGVEAPTVVPVLAAVAVDPTDNPAVREAAAAAVGKFADGGAAAAGQLAKVVSDAKAAVGLRRAALMSLGKVTSDAKVVWPAAQGALQDADPTLRGQAVRVAGPLGKVAKEVIPTLEKLARKDANIEVRIAAIQELGALGAAAKAVERTLSELAESDPRPTVREAAQAALKQVRAKASP